MVQLAVADIILSWEGMKFSWGKIFDLPRMILVKCTQLGLAPFVTIVYKHNILLQLYRVNVYVVQA